MIILSKIPDNKCRHRGKTLKRTASVSFAVEDNTLSTSSYIIYFPLSSLRLALIFIFIHLLYSRSFALHSNAIERILQVSVSQQINIQLIKNI